MEQEPRQVNSMNKTVLMLLPFLVACQSLVGAPRAIPSSSGDAAVSALGFDTQCYHLCWMGINPGVTTASNVQTILSKSNQIDHTSLQASASEISAAWNAPLGPPLNYRVYVRLTVEKGLVETISFSDMPLRIKDVTARIGEPDKISITFVRTAESQHLFYDLYYSSRKLMLDVYLGSVSGPDPDDYIGDLYLNKEFIIAPWQAPIQPWLGYGHAKEYLPGGLHLPAESTPTVSP